jgi:hypothetical protein
MASVKTRILRYRKKRVREAGSYIGGHCAKARHSSILYVTARAACTEAPQTTRQQAASHSHDRCGLYLREEDPSLPQRRYADDADTKEGEEKKGGQIVHLLY